MATEAQTAAGSLESLMDGESWCVSNFLEYRQLKDISPQTVIRQNKACEKCATRNKTICYCSLAKELLAHHNECKYWPPVAKEAEELYQVKCALSEYDIHKWSQHTDTTFPASKIKPMIRAMTVEEEELTPPEMLTNAWLKYYEILHRLNLINPERSDLKTLHLCECPGAFIAATNHYLKTEAKGVDWEWKAISLDTYHECNDWFEMLDNDQFYKETYGYWLRGHDGSGNLLKLKNLVSTLNLLHSRRWQANLVTGDGSFNTQHNAGQQEELVFPLLLAETLTALGCLAPGGHYVLKSYSLLTNVSIGLVAVIANSFQQVFLVKPFLSKPGNSEIYIVGKGFVGISQTIFNACRDTMERPIKSGAIFIPDQFLSPSFVKEIVLHVSAFAQRQMENIQQNVESFLNNENPFAEAKDILAEQWIQMTNIQWIKKTDKIVPETFLGGLTVDGNDLHQHRQGSRMKTLPTYSERHQERKQWNDMLDARLAIFLKKQEGDHFRCGWVSHPFRDKSYVTLDLAEVSSALKSRKKIHEPFSYNSEESPASKLLTSKVIEFLITSVSSDNRKLARFGSWLELAPLLKPYRVVSSLYFSQDIFRTLLRARMACPSEFLPISFADIGCNMKKEANVVHPLSLDIALLLITRHKLCNRINWLEISLASITNEDCFDTPLSLPLRSVASNSGIVLDAITTRDGAPAKILETSPSSPSSTTATSSKVKIIRNGFNNLDHTSKVLSDEYQRTRETPNLIIIDIINTAMHREICQNEAEDQRRLLRSLKVALKFLSEKGELIVALSSTLTRFTGSLILLLSTVFKDINIWRPPTAAPWTQRRYLYCRQLDRAAQLKSAQFKFRIDLVRACLNKCLMDLEKRKDPLISLHFILPPVLFSASPFVEWLQNANDAFALEELASIEGLLEARAYLAQIEKQDELRALSPEGLKEVLNESATEETRISFEKYLLALKIVSCRRYRHLAQKVLSLFSLSDLFDNQFETTRAWLEKARSQGISNFQELSNLPFQSIGLIQGSLDEFRNVTKVHQTVSQLVTDPTYKKWGLDFLDDVSKPEFAAEKQYFFDSVAVTGAATVTSIKLSRVEAERKAARNTSSLGHRLTSLMEKVSKLAH